MGKGIANYNANSPTKMELKIEFGQSKDFDSTSNAVIRGDNLHALKILRGNYYGMIKAIYIDPPYNTEKGDFVYNDNFKNTEKDLIENLGLDTETVERFQDLYGDKTHSGWLSFMYPRLKVARDLLTDDGVIFISIDDHEHANLKLMCDEIFSEHNLVGTIVWEGGIKNDSRFLSISTDYILVYAKNLALMRENRTTWRLRKEGIDLIYKKVEALRCTHGDDYNTMTKELRTWYKSLDKKNAAWRHRHYKSIDKHGVYFPGDISWPGSGGPRYDVMHPKTGRPVKVPKSGWRFPNKSSMDTKIKENRIEFGLDESSVPQLKRYLHETEDQVMANVVYKDRRAAKKALDSLMTENVFDDPKDVDVIKDVLNLATQKSDIVLDFFAGSGTTGEAVMKLNAEDDGNRKFILVQIDETIKLNKNQAIKFCKNNRMKPVISSITIERLNRAGDAIGKAHPNVDVGYKVFSLKPRPSITGDGSQVRLLSARPAASGVDDTLYNMLCATGKPLDTPITTVVEDRLYEVEGEMYVLGDVDLSKYRDRKINVDGWGENNTLEQYLNLPRSNVDIIY